jgi:phosphoribosylaminoimidazole-succinocarboxamide synthase
LWWFDQLTDVAPHHVITADAADYPSEFEAYADALRGRSMLCRRLDMMPVECVARGYLTGSALTDYQRTGAVHGIPLPAGLLDGSRLSEPIFTPTTKAPFGKHDAPMTYDDVVATVGADRAEQLRSLTLDVYRRANDLAATAGVILADTKLEFGAATDGTLVLADEVLTPDSSRFWPADGWQPGRAQPSYDKQFVRDWLMGPHRPAATVAGRGGRADPGKVHRGVRAAHRPPVRNSFSNTVKFAWQAHKGPARRTKVARCPPRSLVITLNGDGGVGT